MTRGFVSGFSPSGSESAASMQRLESLPGHISLEAAEVRAAVEREGAATREHVADQVRELRDRVSDAERAVTATGQHAAVTVSTPLAPEATSRPGSSPGSSTVATSTRTPTLPSIGMAPAG
jgi:hypothetical protein